MKEVCFCTLIMYFCFRLQALTNYKISKQDKYFVKCFLKKQSTKNANESQLNFGILFGFLVLGILFGFF